LTTLIKGKQENTKQKTEFCEEQFWPEEGKVVKGRLLGSCTRGESRPFNYGRLNKQYVLLLRGTV